MDMPKQSPAASHHCCANMHIQKDVCGRPILTGAWDWNMPGTVRMMT